MKTFSLKDVYACDPCEEEWSKFNKFLSGRRYNWSQPVTSDCIKEIKSIYPIWYKWLLEKGLVEEEKKVPKISLGMRVPKGVLSFQECLICCAFDKVGIIVIKSGFWWSDFLTVRSTTDINIEEFRKMLGTEGHRAEEIASKLLPPLE
jgi:hypothetical protein